MQQEHPRQLLTWLLVILKLRTGRESCFLQGMQDTPCASQQGSPSCKFGCYDFWKEGTTFGSRTWRHVSSS
eukprot:11843854-Prorocentrum_lima.AAC.1